jgi:hypothetical protein
MGDERGNGVCGTVDEDTIELQAMGRLQSSSVRQHLDTCNFCRARVAEHRAWIEDLKRALQERQQAGRATGPWRDVGYASRQDDT